MENSNDWPQIKARLEDQISDGDYWSEESRADIRAALRRVEACEAAFKRQGELLGQARQRVEELEREARLNRTSAEKHYERAESYCAQAEAAEAKLARVEEALEGMVEKWAPHCGLCVDFVRDPEGHLVVNHCVCDPLHKQARAALAAAKGEK